MGNHNLEELRQRFLDGEIMVDPDDPRTTRGLTSEEVAFIRSEPHWLCNKYDCDCDEQFEKYHDSIL